MLRTLPATATRVLAAAALLLLVLAPMATAHPELESSVPTKGSRLAVAPGFVSITITEPADPAGTTMTVVDAQGDQVDLGDLTITAGNHPTLRVSLPSSLADGAYRIVWRVLSVSDGHTTHGTVGFAVGDFAPPDSQASDLTHIAWLGASGRFLAFLGLSLALGSLVFLVWVPGLVEVPRRPVLETLMAGAVLHLVGVAFLLKSTLDQTQLPLPGLATTAIGQTLILRIGLALGALVFASIALAPRIPARLPPYAAILLLAASGLGSARFGHASLIGLSGIVVDGMHLFAAAGWAGGLLVFLWLLIEAHRMHWEGAQVRIAGVRFGTAALACVIVLLAAGLGTSLSILGMEGLRHPWAAVSSSWGRVLAAKVALTLGMLALAVVNRYGILEADTTTGLAGRIQAGLGRVAPRLRSIGPHGDGLRRLLRVEALLGVCVLALAAVLTSISPPSAATVATAPLSVTGFGLEFHGELTIDPAPVVGGTSSLTVHIETHQGNPVEGNTCAAQPPSSCVSAVLDGVQGNTTYALQPIGGGDWRVEGVVWGAADDNTVTVTVRTSDVPEDQLGFQFNISPNA